MTAAPLHPALIICRLSGDMTLEEAQQVWDAARSAHEDGCEFSMEWEDVTSCDLGALQLLNEIPPSQRQFHSAADCNWIQGWLQLARATG